MNCRSNNRPNHVFRKILILVGVDKGHVSESAGDLNCTFVFEKEVAINRLPVWKCVNSGFNKRYTRKNI